MRSMTMETRTEDDSIELIGTLVHMGQQDAAGLERGQELGLPRLSQGGQEGVAGLGDTLLQHRRIVRHRVHILHKNHVIAKLAC